MRKVFFTVVLVIGCMLVKLGHAQVPVRVAIPQPYYRPKVVIVTAPKIVRVARPAPIVIVHRAPVYVVRRPLPQVVVFRR